jgi:alpha-galactosidase
VPLALFGLVLLLCSFSEKEAEAGPSAERTVALTPPMGWNSWNKFGCNVSESLIKEMADAMVTRGMKDAGYQYVNVDDCWQVRRSPKGTILADPLRFPSGIKALADYVHSKGLKFGLYTDAGSQTCQGRPGSLGYEKQDAMTYAGWGVDYVKHDWCYTPGLKASRQYKLMSDSLKASGRDMVFSICNWGEDSTTAWAPLLGNLWRTTGDIQDNWKSIISIIDLSSPHAAVAGPGRWNDPDMLEVGNGGMSPTEYRSHFSLWAIMAAPLIAGNDLRSMSPETAEILMNKEVIAVNQDQAGIQGTPVIDDGALQVWSKPLSLPGTRAVALFNRKETPSEITVHWSDLGLEQGPTEVRDLWLHQERGMFTHRYSASIPPHGVVMLKIKGKDQRVPVGQSSISDLPWIYAANYWGPVERDRSNGEKALGDGRPLQLKGKTYAKGLGVHAPSRISYRIDGKRCTFSSDLGVDDEVGKTGSVEFQVWADGLLVYQSPLLEGGKAPQSIRLDLKQMDQLDLVVTGGQKDHNYDHANWAGATISCK